MAKQSLIIQNVGEGLWKQAVITMCGLNVNLNNYFKIQFNNPG